MVFNPRFSLLTLISNACCNWVKKAYNPRQNLKPFYLLERSRLLTSIPAHAADFCKPPSKLNTLSKFKANPFLIYIGLILGKGLFIKWYITWVDDILCSRITGALWQNTYEVITLIFKPPQSRCQWKNGNTLSIEIHQSHLSCCQLSKTFRVTYGWAMNVI